MTKEYKLSKNSKWIYLYKILLVTISITFVFSYVYTQYKRIPNEDLFLIILLGPFLVWLIIFGIPLLLLYFNHQKNSKLVTFSLDDDSFNYSNHKEQISFRIEDIEKIELWLTPPAYDKRIDWQFFGKYHFTSIKMKKGNIIYISCLVFDRTEEVFPSELIEKKKKFFPLIKK